MAAATCRGFSEVERAAEQQDEADERRSLQRTHDGTAAHSRATARGVLRRRSQLILVLGRP